MAEFIFESGANSLDVATKKAIRSHAMRHFREKQRERGVRSGSIRRKKLLNVRDTFVAARPLLPAIVADISQDAAHDSKGLSEGSNAERPGPELPDADRSIAGKGIGRAQSMCTDTPLAHCSEFTNHHVWRQQLGHAFITSYYPDSVTDAIYKDWHNFEPGEAAGHTFHAARDALCLIHLGIRFRDGRLLHDGRKRHCAGLRLLRERIERPDSIVCDGLLDACYTLAHCQIYQAISGGDQGWQVHLEGLRILLRRRGAESFKSSFANATLHKIRQIAAMDQLIKRESSFLSSSEWALGARKKKPGLHAPTLQLTDWVLQLSGTLENVDLALQLFHTNAPGDHARGLALHLQSLQHRLDQWLLDFYQRTAVEQVPYNLTKMDDYPHYRIQCSDMALLFPEVYCFSSFLSATTHCYLFILHLALRTAQLDLAVLDPTQQTSDSEALTIEAEVYAAHLCKCMPYLSLPQHRSAGINACGGPLYWASAWFERRGDSRKLQACRSAREVLECECPTPLNLRAPAFTWWMLPSIFGDQGAVEV